MIPQRNTRCVAPIRRAFVLAWVALFVAGSALAGSGPAQAAGSGNTLRAGQNLNAGNELRSKDGRFRLAMQGDGNAVLYADGVALWQTGTRGSGNRLRLTPRGQVQVRTGAGQVVWRSGSAASRSRLVLQDDANLVVYSHANGAAWTSRTAMPDCSRVAMSLPRQKMVVTAGFRVHPCVAPSVRRMVRDASRSGVSLRGHSWRSIQSQIKLRIANCGGETHENVWKKPAKDCNPPTAIPGKSMHESGRALDFRNGSGSIKKDSREYAWLKANAPRYGLFNYPQEPWHWSTSGR